MGTNRPRFSVTMSEEMYQQINDFWHNNKFPTQTKAITKILELGIAALDQAGEEAKKEPPIFVKDGSMSMYEALDEIDRAEIRGEMKQMLRADKYQQDSAKMA